MNSRQPTRLDLVVEKIKNNRAFVIISILGIGATGLAGLFTSLEKIGEFISGDPPSGEVKIAQMTVDPKSGWREYPLPPTLELIHGDVHYQCHVYQAYVSVEASLVAGKESLDGYGFRLLSGDEFDDVTAGMELPQNTQCIVEYLMVEDPKLDSNGKPWPPSGSIWVNFGDVPLEATPRDRQLTLHPCETEAAPKKAFGTSDHRADGGPVLDVTLANHSSQTALLVAATLRLAYEFGGGDIGDRIMGSAIEAEHRYEIAFDDPLAILPPLAMGPGQFVRFQLEVLGIQPQMSYKFWLDLGFENGKQLTAGPYILSTEYSGPIDVPSGFSLCDLF